MARFIRILTFTCPLFLGVFTFDIVVADSSFDTSRFAFQHAARYLANQEWVKNDSLKIVENTAVMPLLLFNFVIFFLQSSFLLMQHLILLPFCF